MTPPSWRSEILTALRTRLATATGIGSWMVVYVNREQAVKPDPSTLVLEETPLMTSSIDASIGYAVRWRQVVGTYQLMLAVPVDSDVFPALQFADTLELTFLASPSMTLASGDAIRISNVLVGQPRPARRDDPWVRIPVVITFTVVTHT